MLIPTASELRLFGVFHSAGVKCNATPAEAPCQSHTPKQKKAETPQRGVSTMMWELKIPSSLLANCKFARTGFISFQHCKYRYSPLPNCRFGRTGSIRAHLGGHLSVADGDYDVVNGGAEAAIVGTHEGNVAIAVHVTQVYSNLRPFLTGLFLERSGLPGTSDGVGGVCNREGVHAAIKFRSGIGKAYRSSTAVKRELGRDKIV